MSTFQDSLTYLSQGQLSNAMSSLQPLQIQVPIDLSMTFRRGQNLREFDQLYNELITSSTTKSYREFVQIDWASKTQSPLNVMIQWTVPNYLKIYKKQMVTVTKLRLAQIQSAIHLYYLKKKKWPKSLDDLKPDYLQSIPLDPFIDQPFHTSQDSTGFFTYSVGPDFKDDQAKIDYAPYANQNDPGDIR